MELLQTFNYKNVVAELYYQGSPKLAYKFKVDGEVVSDGNDFKPSPIYSIDDPEVMIDFLGWMALRKGDVDQDFFDKRDEPKLDHFANESDVADEIRLMINDYNLSEEEIEENGFEDGEEEKILQFIT